MIRSLTVCALMIFCVSCAGMAQNGAMIRAYRNYEKGDYEDVLTHTSHAQRYKEPSPELMAEILFLRALALEKLGRDQEAQGVFKYIVTHFTDTEYGYRAEKKVDMKSDDALIYHILGEDYVNKGQFDKAISQLNKALELTPDHALAYLNRGVAYGQKGNNDKALADFNKSISLDPEYFLAYFNRGFLYKVKNQVDKAISDYNNSLELNPEFAPAYYNRADAYIQKNQFNKAISDYNMAIEVNSEYLPAYNGLAYLLATCPDDRYRDGEKAIKLSEKALEISNDNCFVLDTLAAAYAEAGRFKNAVNTEEKAIGLMKKQGDPGGIMDVFVKHLNSYKANKPWREE